MAANHRQVANASVGMRPSLLSYVGRAFEIIGGIVIILGVVRTPALFSFGKLARSEPRRPLPSRRYGRPGRLLPDMCRRADPEASSSSLAAD